MPTKRKRLAPAARGSPPASSPSKAARAAPAPPAAAKTPVAPSPLPSSRAAAPGPGPRPPVPRRAASGAAAGQATIGKGGANNNSKRKAPSPKPPPRATPVRSAAGAAVNANAGGGGVACGGEHSPHGQEESRLSHASDGPRTTDAVDEVINEVNHLLQSAAEAQSLGRLRNSYSCLLLAHQRLVGVGRRVDRSYCEAEEDGPAAAAAADDAAGPGGEGSNLSAESRPPTLRPPLVAQPPLPPALAGDYSDVAYVEHLARSAMELHHRRTGRGMQHDAALERAAHVARMKRVEEEQIHRAARGVFALATGGSQGGGGGGEGEGATPPKRKGGRGKKPPTLVMHTMAGRNLDVRELMRGVL